MPLPPSRSPARALWCSAQPTLASEPQSREKHKIFDEVSISVRGGAGGCGEIVAAGKGKMVRNFKYKPGGNMTKQIWLPASEPDDGWAGADVLLVVDPRVDTLLHLHEKSRWTGADGSNGDPAKGSGGPKRRERFNKKMPPLKVPVPPGTVVRDKRGRMLAQLVNVGDTYCAAAGGLGGAGVVAPSRESNVKARAKTRQELEDSTVQTFDVEDVNWKLDSRGAPGVEAKLALTLRVVADVGLVGLPNAGKSSLLLCMTKAKPEVANYPFTTLMPNLGVMKVGEQGFDTASGRVVLADMPGLIEGAHQGKGLGRMFLRHLGRTEMLVHVVDASSDNPAADYWVVREELRMYSPAYCQRPHVVALNKMDLPDAHELKEELVHEIHAMAASLAKSHPEIHVPPRSVNCCSAETRDGIAEIMQSIAVILKVEQESEAAEEEFDEKDVVDWDTSLPDDEEESTTRDEAEESAESAWGHQPKRSAERIKDVWLS